MDDAAKTSKAWSTLAVAAWDHEKERVKRWQGEINALLVFVSFSLIHTPFRGSTDSRDVLVLKGWTILRRRYSVLNTAVCCVATGTRYDCFTHHLFGSCTALRSHRHST